MENNPKVLISLEEYRELIEIKGKYKSLKDIFDMALNQQQNNNKKESWGRIYGLDI